MKYAFIAFLIAALMAATPAAALVEADVQVDVHSNTLCPCSTLTTEDFEVFVKNMDSRTQEYRLELILPDDELWSGFIVPNVTLSANDVQIAAAFVTSSCWVKPGVYTVGVKVISPVSGESSVKNFDVEVLKCRWVEVTADEYELCQEEESTVELTFVNDGDRDEKIKLSTSEAWAVFPDDSLEIARGEEKTVELVFTPSDDIEGEQTVTLNLDSEISYMRNKEKLSATVRDCYGTELSVEPSRQNVCPCQTADFTLEVKNAGLLEDQYTIRYGDESSEMSIVRNGTGKVSLAIDVPCDKEEGDYPLEIEIDSNDPVSSTVIVGVLSAFECYNVYLYSEDAVNVRPVEIGESETYEIVAVNKGKFTQSYELVLDAPYWIHMSDYGTELAPGNEKFFYVYAAPEYAVEAGSYPVYVAAVGENEKASIEFEVVVVSNFTITEEDEEAVAEEAAETEEPSDALGEEMEADISLPTGQVIGEGEDRPWSQIVMISILAIAVVFVLVLRFVIMMK